MHNQKLIDIFKTELLNFHEGNFDTLIAWKKLERLHVIGQQFILKHYLVHILMLRLALKERDIQEVYGQLLRLLMVAPGHLFKKIPYGNIGSSRVSPFQKMYIPEDLKDFF